MAAERFKVKKKKKPNACPVCREQEEEELKFSRGAWACSKCHNFFGRWTVNAVTGEISTWCASVCTTLVVATVNNREYG